MKPNQRTDNRPQGKSGADDDQRATTSTTRDPGTPPPQSQQKNRSKVRYSPSGEPDQRRDDDVAPSPEGPATGSRGDSDIEGVHERRNTNVERE